MSPSLDLRAESGQGKWLDDLREAGIEFFAVPDTSMRAARLTNFGNCEGVLLADGPAGTAELHGRRGLAAHRTERELVRFARARRLPIVGIGQGAEFLGLYFGGRLRAHPERRPGDRRIDLHVASGFGPPHAQVHPAGRAWCDPKDFPAVLVPIARDEQGNIAGFVHRDEPILGIHWQPASPADGAVDLILDVLRGRARNEADTARALH